MDRRSCVAGMALAGLLSLGITQAEALDTYRVAASLDQPVQVTAPDGDSRLFIVEQKGIIKILKNGDVLPTPFLDIDDKIPDIGGNDERGLLGLAFHPDYANNGYFFVNYISDEAGEFNDTIIERYTVSDENPDVADAASVKRILQVDQPFSNHNGGNLQFGPNDGYLYIGLGDGGSGGDPGDRAQCLDEILGKMLRIDIDTGDAVPYEVPVDNPFADDGDPNTLAEIWAYGLRNPWRYSFDAETGDLYIGDVGQNTWEEVDFQPAASTGGENYGWRVMEGNHCYAASNCPDSAPCNDPSLTDPIHEYQQVNGNCSVTGGFVYRGDRVPEIDGVYFFADFCTAKIWSFRYDGSNLTEFTDRTAELAPGGGLAINLVASFGEDGHKELYIVDRGGVGTGEIYKIVSDIAGTDDPAISRPLKIGPAYPNPFSDRASFRLDLSRDGVLDLSIVDAAGRVIRRLGSEATSAGSFFYHWDGRDNGGRRAPSGVYFINASFDGSSLARPIHLLR